MKGSGEAATRLGVRPGFLIALALAAATLAAYAGVLGNGFVDYDDDLYVFRNRRVLAGLSWPGLSWALTTGHASNWHPLTWISHMLDAELWGSRPAGHHATSVLLHVASSLLLFAFWRRTTGRLWPSGLVAALFALHPLHVESVAWASERKDTLSGFFFMVTLLAYARYAERPGVRRYLVVAASFVLGLMAKPMLVTLPCVCLLLDRWPLARWGSEARRARLAEKVPLLLIAAGSSAVTFVVQSRGGAVSSLHLVPLESRLAGAAVAYLAYLGDFLWPARLAAFYPYPRERPGAMALLALLALVSLTAAFLWAGRRRPYLTTGWLWYLGTLVPVIGLVQVGEQARADRYTYLPLIGVFVMIAWGMEEIVVRLPRVGLVLRGAVIVALAVLALLTRAQVGYWRNSETLFAHALEVTPRNHVACYGLGFALAERGEGLRAMQYFNEAVRLRPDYPEAHVSIASELARQGRTGEAKARYRIALRLRPDRAEVHNNLGSVLFRERDFAAAEHEFATAVRLDPESPEMRYNLGIALAAQNLREPALAAWRDALRVDPSYAPALRALHAAARVPTG